MSSEEDPSLPVHATEDVRGSCTSCATLHKFAWALRRCSLPSSTLRAVPGRATLAVWLGKLDLRNWGEEVSPGILGVDEGLLDLIVLSVESGCTPREVLVWIFPSFGCLLFDMIKGEGGSI